MELACDGLALFLCLGLCVVVIGCGILFGGGAG